MFDAKIRPLIDSSLNPIGHWLASLGLLLIMSPSRVLAGLLAFIFIAFDLAIAGLCMIILNRVADGLDGAVARSTGQTDFGGYLDLVVDFIFYSAIPLAFAIANPDHAIAACFLCVISWEPQAPFRCCNLGCETQCHNRTMGKDILLPGD